MNYEDDLTSERKVDLETKNPKIKLLCEMFHVFYDLTSERKVDSETKTPETTDAENAETTDAENDETTDAENAETTDAAKSKSKLRVIYTNKKK